MPITSGFDQDQSSVLIDQVQLGAWNRKEDFLKAPIQNEFSLVGLTEDKIEEVTVPGGNRLTMPSMEPKRLTYEPLKLMTGIFAGDFEGTDHTKVRIYYPHVRKDQLVGVTIYHMDISEAAILLKRAASVLDIDTDQLKQAARGMLSRFTIFEEQQMEIHKNDIAASLAEKI